MTDREVLRLIIENQREQDKRLDALELTMGKGFAEIKEHLADYTAVKAQVFDWRAGIRVARNIAVFLAGVATFGAALAKMGVFK